MMRSTPPKTWNPHVATSPAPHRESNSPFLRISDAVAFVLHVLPAIELHTMHVLLYRQVPHQARALVGTYWYILKYLL